VRHPSGQKPKQRRREDAGPAVEARQLSPGVHIDQSPGEHGELADPLEGAGLDRDQTHQQVDDEERKDRHQAQGEEVKGAVLLIAGIDGGRDSAVTAT
jgi:hypothetical protein